LPIFPLLERELKPSFLVLDAKDSDVDWLSWFAVDDYRFFESCEGRVTDHALHLGHIDLFDHSLGVQKTHGEVAIV